MVKLRIKVRLCWILSDGTWVAETGRRWIQQLGGSVDGQRLATEEAELLESRAEKKKKSLVSSN